MSHQTQDMIRIRECQKLSQPLRVSDNFTIPSPRFSLCFCPFATPFFLGRSAYAAKPFLLLAPGRRHWLLTAGHREQRASHLYHFPFFPKNLRLYTFFFPFFWRGRGSPPPSPMSMGDQHGPDTNAPPFPLTFLPSPSPSSPSDQFF